MLWFMCSSLKANILLVATEQHGDSSPKVKVWISHINNTGTYSLIFCSSLNANRGVSSSTALWYILRCGNISFYRESVVFQFTFLRRDPTCLVFSLITGVSSGCCQKNSTEFQILRLRCNDFKKIWRTQEWPINHNDSVEEWKQEENRIIMIWSGRGK